MNERIAHAQAQALEEREALGRLAANASDDFLFYMNPKETVAFTSQGIRRDYACHICGVPGGH